MSLKKWTKLSTRIVFEHPRLKLLEDEVLLPSGKKTQYLKFDEKNHAVALIVLDKGRILLQREYSYPTGRFLYQFPGGGLKLNEEKKIGANRELQEETGLKANKLTLLGWFYTNNRRSGQKMFVYLAEELEKSKLKKDEEEFIENGWITIEELEKIIGEMHNFALLSSWCLFEKCLRQSCGLGS